MNPRQRKAVVGSGVFFLTLAAILLHEPEPNLVPSEGLTELLEDADLEVRRRKAISASKAVERVGLSLGEWSTEGEGLSVEQRSHLSLFSREARLMAADMPGSGLELDGSAVAAWSDLRSRLDRTFAGD